MSHILYDLYGSEKNVLYVTIMKKSILFLLLFPVIAANAQVSERADSLILAEMQKTGIPGVALAVIKDGKVVKKSGYGLANIETQTPVSSASVFKIASISKPMIAMGIMILSQEGKLQLDDPVGRYLPATPESWKPITIRHFLSHTSGVVRESPGFDGYLIQPDTNVIKAAYNEPLRFTPGEKYEYCNVGYYSLAEIIRAVSGKPWHEFLAERIFRPLGMDATRTTSFTEIVPHRVNAYSLQGGKLENTFPFLTLRPSGAFLSSLDDLIQWNEALTQRQLLTPESYNAIWTPFRLNNGTDSEYGLGWSIDRLNNRRRVRHGGSLNGFKSEFVYYRDVDLTVILLTNLNEAIPAKIAEKVADLYLLP